MQRKKIGLLASILMATLIVGVYAGTIISNTVTATWTLETSITDLELYWADGGAPTGAYNRGIWIQTKIGLKNTKLATYTVTDNFTITASSYSLPTDCIKIEYLDGTDWVDMTGVLTGWNTLTLKGYFGPITGFTVGPGYDHATDFRIMFDGNAPLAAYEFNAWVEEV